MANHELISTSLEFQKSVDLIKGDLALLPNNPYTNLFKSLTGHSVDKLYLDGIDMNDVLFVAGVTLAHAKVHAGIIENAEQIGRGFYIPDVYGWNKREFAVKAIDGYVRGFAQSKVLTPPRVSEGIQSLFPYWCRNVLGVEPTEQIKYAIFNPMPVVLPFDHLPFGIRMGRYFAQEIMHYPKSAERRVFEYMKGWYLPPTRFVSDRPQNDTQHLVASKIARGISETEALTDRHEGVHLNMIDIAVEVAKKGQAHSGISEGIAQFYGDSFPTQQYYMEYSAKDLPIYEIPQKKDGTVDYGWGLLLVSALAANFGGGVNEDAVKVGMENVILKIIDYARLVTQGEAPQLENALALLYVINPSLEKQLGEKGELLQLMRELRGKFTS